MVFYLPPGFRSPGSFSFLFVTGFLFAVLFGNRVVVRVLLLGGTTIVDVTILTHWTHPGWGVGPYIYIYIIKCNNVCV